MKEIIYFSNLKWLLLSLLIAILDMFTKGLVVCNCVFEDPLVISSFVNCYYTHNFGIAFGLFSDFCFEKDRVLLFIIILIIFILCIMLCFINKSIRGYFCKISYAMIIGGAIGNMFDRMFYGVVIDFIDFHIGNYHFPTFNFADINIFIGSILIVCIHK